MIRLGQSSRTLPFFEPAPLTRLPLIFHREHLFPYTSYGETSPTSYPRSFRSVILENAALRLEVIPELGGRIYSLFDRRIGQEILFSNPVVKPVRILPIWAFISGGMEFNFPIAHSPTSIAEVGYASGQFGDYGFIRVGEREARTGMEWMVELGLKGDEPVLIQRSAFRNLTPSNHPWMSWTITAVRSTEETEFIHPPHRVLVHNDRVADLDWPGDGLNWNRNSRQMTAFFWKPGSATAFGVFHHDLGFGLMHAADPAQLPGKKVWTYGFGPHRSWGQASTDGHLCYCEIESGPLIDQSEKPLFPSGAERRFEEFWIPVHSRRECHDMPLPKMDLPPMINDWPGWQHSRWQVEWEQFRAGEGPLPHSQVATGIELEQALRREWEGGNAHAAEPLGLWLAFHERTSEALRVVEQSALPGARRLAGLILWKALQQPARAVPFLEAGPLEEPIAVMELDLLYTALNLIGKRAALLAKAPPHRLLVERQAALALQMGKPEETLQWLRNTCWPREHQRYVRTDIWQAANAALGNPNAAVPETLHEDNLARFGAYWSTE